MATVGETSSSITRPNGAVTPVASNCSRVSIRGSNLEKRSLKSVRLELFDRIDQLADRFNLRLLVHCDEDVELVLDVGDEIEHCQAVPFKVLREAGLVADLDPLLVERFDQGLHPGVGFGSVGHARVPYQSRGLSQSNGAQRGRCPKMEIQSGLAFGHEAGLHRTCLCRGYAMSEGSEPKLVNPDDPVFPKEVHNLLVAANATNITLSGMADTKASILMGASFVVFSMSISDISEGKASLPLLVLTTFAFIATVFGVLTVRPTRLPVAKE